MNIDTIFNNLRVESNLNAVLVLLYFPIGSVLLLFRLFLTLNFICAQIVFNVIFTQQNVIRRLFEKVFLAVLGVAINSTHEELRNTKCLAVANQLTNCDSLFFCLLCSFRKMGRWGVQSSLLDVLSIERRTESREIKRKSLRECYKQGHSVIIFPEPQPTNGKGLLKFEELEYADDMQIQPIAVRAHRVIPVTMTTIDSTWWQDLLWTYFSLITIYNVTYLPAVSKKSHETCMEFTECVQKAIAQELDVPSTNFTKSDIREHLKRMKFEARRPQSHLQAPNSQLQLKANQVKGILPHVPLNVIKKDLGKTNSVDLTVTNILEGLVKFVPEDPNQPTSSQSAVKQTIAKPASRTFSRDPTSRHMSLQEKKEAFIKEARRAYLAKRGIEVDSY